MDIVLAHANTCADCAQKDQLIARLTAERDEAEKDPIWGIYSRNGIERRIKHLTATMATIVLDWDDMHGCNDRFGHDGVDARISKTLDILRDVLMGRWLRGDEVVIFTHQDDALGAAQRLLHEGRLNGMSATIAVVYQTGYDAIARGITRIEEAKRINQRGRVLVVNSQD